MPRSMHPALAAIVALGACIGAPRTAGGTGQGARASGANVTVLERDQLAKERGTLLDAMIGQVPNLVVNRTANCPSLALRGPSAVPGSTEPQVYVDGTRAHGTCILTGLRAVDVERVEIYPMGVTSRPGYATNSNGLILVFLREGDD